MTPRPAANPEPPPWTTDGPPVDEATPRSPRRLQIQHARDVLDSPPPNEVIEGIAWSGCLTLLVGESGAGKSFVTLSLAAAVSAGTSWHGRHTQIGTVVYLICESDDFPRRLRALVEKKGYRLEHLYVIRLREPLSPTTQRDGETPSTGERALIETLKHLAGELDPSGAPPIALLIVDTVRASMAGNEDSSEHVSSYLRAMQRIVATVPRAAVILSHHAGWQDGDTQRKRERGSSAWRGNVDATLYLEAGAYNETTGEAELTLRTLKVRDAERPAPLQLIRRRVELEQHDHRGRPLTSCVIERDPRTREDRAAESQAATSQAERDIDLRTLKSIIERPDLATSQDNLRRALGVRKAIVGASLDRLVLNGWVTPGSRGKPYQTTQTGLTALEAAS